MCFVDFKKAFDSISRDKLWVTMMALGYPLHLIDLLSKLYKKQLDKVKVAKTLSEWFRVKKGVRQGCVLSPYLFNILAEMVMNLRILMHKAREHQQPLYMCFVDFKKAFDSISRDKIWVTMMGMVYPLH